MIRTALLLLPLTLASGVAVAQGTATMPGVPPQGGAPTMQGMPAMPGGAGMPSAQQQADMMRLMAVSARNQLGVLEYCRDKGFIGPETVAIQQKMLTMLPPTSTDGLAEAEATGRSGVVSVGTAHTSLDEAATRQSTTVDALCKKMAGALTEAAKSLPQ